MSDGPYYQPPSGHIAQVIPADGWCAVDDEGVHVPLVAWTLVIHGDDFAALVPFTSRFDAPEGTADRGTILDTFEPVVGDLIFMCGSRCADYRENYLDRIDASYHFGAHPLPGSLARYNVIQVMPAAGWCAVYDISKSDSRGWRDADDSPLAHAPLSAWALVEERTGKPKNRWRGVVGLDADGAVTGPTVAANFVRYSRCGVTVADIEHLEWRVDEEDEDDEES